MIDIKRRGYNLNYKIHFYHYCTITFFLMKYYIMFKFLRDINTSKLDHNHKKCLYKLALYASYNNVYKVVLGTKVGL